MLTITIPGDEFFDEAVSKFITVGDVDVELEHSLVSLSKWESKYQKPFLGNSEKTAEEIVWYIQFMTISPGVNFDTLSRLSQANMDAINEYIQSKESATTFGMMPERKGRGEIITSELIYYWMTAFNIPWEAQYWHLNRLFALVRICNIKNGKPKKMSNSELAARNRELNAQRRAQLGTRG